MKALEVIIIVIVLLLLVNCIKEPFYASNWTGEPGALSIRPADKVFYQPTD